MSPSSMLIEDALASLRATYFLMSLCTRVLAVIGIVIRG